MDYELYKQTKYNYFKFTFPDETYECVYYCRMFICDLEN